MVRFKFTCAEVIEVNGIIMKQLQKRLFPSLFQQSHLINLMIGTWQTWLLFLWPLTKQVILVVPSMREPHWTWRVRLQRPLGCSRLLISFQSRSTTPLISCRELSNRGESVCRGPPIPAWSFRGSALYSIPAPRPFPHPPRCAAPHIQHASGTVQPQHRAARTTPTLKHVSVDRGVTLFSFSSLRSFLWWVCASLSRQISLGASVTMSI